MFCFNCGEKVNDNAKFCHVCGTKLNYITEKSEVEVVEKEVVSNKTQEMEKGLLDEWDVFDQIDPIHIATLAEHNILHAFFSDFTKRKYGERVYFWTDTVTEKIAVTIENQWISKDEIFYIAFDYGKNMKEGFVITDQNITWSYSNRPPRSIPWQDIRAVQVRKHVLADAIHLVTVKGVVDDEIYLTGIEEKEDFVAKLSQIIYKMSKYTSLDKEGRFKKWPELYATLDIPDDNRKLYSIKQDELEEYIKHSCKEIVNLSQYCETGTPISSPTGKLEKAKKSFNIPTNSNVYFIFDDTIFGSCKSGFAICGEGIYYAAYQKGFISWSEFANTRLVKHIGGSIKIGDWTYNTTTDSQNIFLILKKIQNMLVLG